MSVQMITAVIGTLITSKSVMELSSSIYSNIKDIFQFGNRDVNTSIESLDIERKLRVIDSIINKIHCVMDRYERNDKDDVNKEKKENKKKDVTNNKETKSMEESTSSILNESYFVVTDEDTINSKTNPVNVTIFYLYDIAQKINREFNNLKRILREHQTTYFAFWRCEDPSPLIRRLKMHSIILDSRKDELLKLLAIKIFTHKS